MNPVKTATGGFAPPPKPKFLVLSSDELDGAEETKILRDYIKVDRVKFEIGPGGFAPVSVQEECRALCDLENFDTLYDLTMQYLVDRTLTIVLINDDRSESELGAMHIPNKDADLRTMQCVAEFPWLVMWLTEFMAGYLAKKFPLPGKTADPKAASKKKKT